MKLELDVWYEAWEDVQRKGDIPRSAETAKTAGTGRITQTLSVDPWIMPVKEFAGDTSLSSSAAAT